jgi:hypothetical protein
MEFSRKIQAEKIGFVMEHMARAFREGKASWAHTGIYTAGVTKMPALRRASSNWF